MRQQPNNTKKHQKTFKAFNERQASSHKHKSRPIVNLTVYQKIYQKQIHTFVITCI